LEPVDGAPCFFSGSNAPGGCGLQSTDSLSGFLSAGNGKIQGGLKGRRSAADEGGLPTKIHAVTDAVGRLIDFDLSAGQAGDIRFAIPLLSRLPAPDHQLADTAYDGDAFRAFRIKRKTVPVIGPNPTRKQVPACDEARYKQRNVVERCFSHLKDWRRVATRYDKPARNFAASVALAAILIWWTSLSPEPSPVQRQGCAMHCTGA